MPTVYINGKFTTQRATGVQRVARELVMALDALAPPGRWALLTPPGSGVLPLQHIAQQPVGYRGLPWHLWEQTVLPWAARDGLLLSLAGSAPFLARRQAALLHDAAVFDHPEAYTRSFVAWYRRLFRRLALRAERLFTVSSFSQARLALALAVPAQRFTVLPNGCDHMDAIVPDPTILERHGLVNRRFLLAVASANPTKNLPALLAAFAALPGADGLRLVIVGGSNTRVFSDTAGATDPPGVIRTGTLDDAPLKALYGAAAALVFPSLYEGFGLPPLEAMACGCPVAAARAASLPEVCGDAARYFDPSSVPAITAALRDVLHDAALRQCLQAAGRERAAAHRWSRPAAGLLAALGGGDYA